jgi:SWIM zinc finger
MMLELLVEGSTGDHYTVTFTREDDNLRASCTCQAGQNRIHCKHRLSLLAGDVSNVAGDLPKDIGTKITALLAGSDIEQALEKLRIAEASVSAAQAEFKRVKKALDRVMHS